MAGANPSFFEGLSVEDVAQALDRLNPRHFAAGATVIAEGDTLHDLYIIRSGTADVFITDRDGHERLVNRVGPGATLGEMSLFTAQPASASVRAITDLDVLILDEAAFNRTLARFPRIYHNLGAILSHRLAQSERRFVGEGLENLTLLLDSDGPPVLGYALACSLAWHTRSAALLLVVTDTAPPPELQAFAATVGGTRSWDPSRALPASIISPGMGPRAYVMLVGSGETGPADIQARRVERLCDCYDHVLVQVRGEPPPALLASHIVRLAGPRSPLPARSDIRGHTVRAWSDVPAPSGPDASGVVHVPALGHADTEPLRAGRLPGTTPAGRALGWLARDLAGLKVGVALGSGSAKGYAHIGVLRVFERAGLAADYLSGTSVGAAVAFLHAAGHRTDESADILDRVGASLFRLTLPVRSLLSSASLRRALQLVGRDSRIEDLPVPLAIVATDIFTGREVVLRRGPAWRAVLASIAIPGVYPPVRIGPHLLVDGGVLNPVPSNVAAEMGANTVVAVKLGGRSDLSAARPGRGFPSTLQTIIRSIEIMEGKIAADAAGVATVLIEPEFGDVAGLGLRDFHQGRRYIEVGEAAAEAALPRIAAAFPWLRS